MMQVYIQYGEVTKLITVNANNTIGELKNIIEKELGIDAHRQRISWNCKQLQDAKTVENYGILHCNTLELFVKASQGNMVTKQRSETLRNWMKIENQANTSGESVSPEKKKEIQDNTLRKLKEKQKQLQEKDTIENIEVPPKEKIVSQKEEQSSNLDTCKITLHTPDGKMKIISTEKGSNLSYLRHMICHKLQVPGNAWIELNTPKVPEEERSELPNDFVFEDSEYALSIGSKKKLSVKVRSSSIMQGDSFEVEVKTNILVSSLKKIIHKRMKSLGMDLPCSPEKLCLYHKLGEVLLSNHKSVSQIEGCIYVEFGSEIKKEFPSESSLKVVPMVSVPSVQEVVANVEFHKLKPQQQDDVLLLTAYLSEYNEGKKLENCTGSIDETTTAMVAISHLMKEYDIQTGVLPASTQDSYIQQRFKGGIEFARKTARLNLGSIAALAIETEDPNDNPTLAPKFHFCMDMDYDKTIEECGGIGKFADAFVNDVATALKVPKASVIVQQVRRGSIKVDFIILANYVEMVEEGTMRADDVIKKVKDTNSSLYTGAVTKFLDQEKSIDVQFVPIFNEFDFTEDDFDPQYNMDYTGYQPLEKAEEKRGSHDYFPPFGYYRHALNIKKMNYDTDDKWIGMNNVSGEWCVAYHGTSKVGVDGIMKRLKTKQNWDPNFMRADACHQDVQSKNSNDDSEPVRKYQEGLYCTPNIEIAGCYSQIRGGFSMDIQGQGGYKYNLVFMCRVNPEQFDHIPVSDEVEHGKQGYYWRVFPRIENNKKMWDLRPYGILLKKM